MVSHPAPARSPKSASKSPAGPGRPKDLGKRAAILQAAKALFLSEGFDGASMDRIAAEAGVSKLTVYSHFGDKEALFFEAIRAKCDEMLPQMLFQQELKGPLRAQLLAIARAFFGLVSSDEAIAMHRMMLMPGQAETPLREAFWSAGPQRILDAFATFLDARVASGELDIPDVPRASAQFFCLVKGELHSQMMCGVSVRPGRAEVTAHLEASVDLFLRAYAPR